MGKILFKIMTVELFEKSRGQTFVAPMPIDENDGYIHLSDGAQLKETLRLYFSGKGPHMLLGVAQERITDEVRYEASRGGQLFAHIYGQLPQAAVEWAEVIDVASDGSMVLPDQMNDQTRDQI